jgi:hypothetical protein
MYLYFSYAPKKQFLVTYSHTYAGINNKQFVLFRIQKNWNSNIFDFFYDHTDYFVIVKQIFMLKTNRFLIFIYLLTSQSTPASEDLQDK